MGAVPATQHMTAEEFLALPCSKEHRWRQLVEGELIVDPPRPLHQWVAGEVRSPSTWRYDIGPKKAACSPQLDGFELPLAELFPE